MNYSWISTFPSDLSSLVQSGVVPASRNINSPDDKVFVCKYTDPQGKKWGGIMRKPDGSSCIVILPGNVRKTATQSKGDDVKFLTVSDQSNVLWSNGQVDLSQYDEITGSCKYSWLGGTIDGNNQCVRNDFGNVSWRNFNNGGYEKLYVKKPPATSAPTTTTSAPTTTTSAPTISSSKNNKVTFYLYISIPIVLIILLIFLYYKYIR